MSCALRSQEELREFLDWALPSRSMREYLLGWAWTDEDLSALLRATPAPLEEKLAWLDRLAGLSGAGPEGGPDSFRALAGLLRRGLQKLALEPGALFLLRECWYDETKEWEEETSTGTPFYSLDGALAYVRRMLEEEEIGRGSTFWCELERWTPDETGRLVQTDVYTLWMDQVIYWTGGSGRWAPFSLQLIPDLNLPIPFHAGDLVAIDCRPFRPPRLAVLLEVGDNRDCCCVQALCGDQDSGWTVGALKHGSLFRTPGSRISPLLRLKDCPETTLDTLWEQLLCLRVMGWIGHDEARGRALWERLSAAERPLTEAAILAALEELEPGS